MATQRFTEAHEYIADMIAGKIESAELATAILNKFGGVEGIASELRLSHDALPAGNPTKVRIQKMVIDLAIGYADVGRPEDDMTDEELMRAVEQIDREVSEAKLEPTGSY